MSINIQLNGGADPIPSQETHLNTSLSTTSCKNTACKPWVPLGICLCTCICLLSQNIQIFGSHQRKKHLNHFYIHYCLCGLGKMNFKLQSWASLPPTNGFDFQNSRTIHCRVFRHLTVPSGWSTVSGVTRLHPRGKPYLLEKCCDLIGDPESGVFRSILCQ